jgi:hypothetical protein
MALAFAIVVVMAQIEWAPAHDTVPLNGMIAQAREQLAVDRQNAAPHLAIATDQQTITNLTSQLSRATARDQGLALMVTLGADISAWPAVVGLLYMTATRRRRRLRPHIGHLEEEIATLEREHNQIPIRITYETQQVLEELGLNPDLVLADPLPPDLPPPRLPLPLPPGSTNGPSHPAGQDEGGGATPPSPPTSGNTTSPGNGSESPNGNRPSQQEAHGDGNGNRPVAVDDLFRADADQATEDLRWTDPL